MLFLGNLFFGPFRGGFKFGQILKVKMVISLTLIWVTILSSNDFKHIWLLDLKSASRFKLKLTRYAHASLQPLVLLLRVNIFTWITKINTWHKLIWWPVYVVCKRFILYICNVNLSNFVILVGINLPHFLQFISISLEFLA